MKTLFITNTYLRGNSGGIYATKAYINAFALLSDSMTLVYAMKHGMEAQGVFEDRIHMIPVWDYRSNLRKIIDLCLGTVNRFQRNIFQYVNPKDYDTVVFNNSEVSSGLIKKFRKLGLCTITIHHNYQIEYLRGDCSRLTLLPSLFWTYIYESTAVRNSTLNLTLTKQDIDLLSQHYGYGKFDVLGVFEYILSSEKKYKYNKRGHRYVITGWLGSKQTEDSLIPWIKNYYPLLKLVDPEAILIIAGRDPSAHLCELAKKNNIIVIPSPNDMQPILDESDYYICPTDRGGGLKLRNMDSFKSGLQVLSHEVSARGYEHMKELGILCSYHDGESFKNGIKTLLNSRKSKMEVLREYQKYYSLESGTKRLDFILKNSIQDKL